MPLPKNVKIWIWLPYKAVDAQMEEAFPLYEKWGVAGLKIDFIERDDQRGIDFYYRAAREAAPPSSDARFPWSHKAERLGAHLPNVLGYEAVSGWNRTRAARATIPITR